jgi:hypothetical protein
MGKGDNNDTDKNINDEKKEDDGDNEDNKCNNGKNDDGNGEGGCSITTKRRNYNTKHPEEFDFIRRKLVYEGKPYHCNKVLMQKDEVNGSEVL